MYVYVDDKYVYDNASSAEGLSHWLKHYQDLARAEGRKVKIVIEWDYTTRGSHGFAPVQD
jgi:hypothetical protein